MNKEEVGKVIEGIKENSRYLRVSDVHPLDLYLGRNEKGEPTLRYNGEFQAAKVNGSSVLEVKQVKTSSYNSILFSFNSKENISLFYNFCADIINQTEEYSGNNGYVEIVNRYNQWRKMFHSGNSLLNESQIMGLIGELLFLKDFAIEKYGVSNGLNGWSGPEPTHKDFSYGNDWFEIKTISSFKDTVTISSIEQLDSDVAGKLVVSYLEKMSPNFDGVKLNDLVNELFNIFKIDSDGDLFVEKLHQVGYSYNDYYDNFVYNFSGKDTYIVDGDFPRLKLEQLPVGVVKVKYDLSIPVIEKFKERV